jgi:ornithine cyclodeaminase
MSRQLDIDVSPADSAQAAVRGADIVNVITKSATPVLAGEWLEPGQHINAAGSNALARRELDALAIEKSDVITVDARGTARGECGDLLPAVEKGLLRWDALVEIGEVIAGRAAGRTSAKQITLYESHGMGLQDLYVGARMLHLAREQGIGVDLPIGDSVPHPR